MQDELTIKEFVLTLQEYLKHFLRKWYWFLLGAVIAGGVFFLNAYMAPVTFTAPLTFLMKNDKEKSFGAGALLGSLGLGSPDPGKGNASKLLELGKSRRVLGLILFDSAAVDPVYFPQLEVIGDIANSIWQIKEKITPQDS